MGRNVSVVHGLYQAPELIQLVLTIAERFPIANPKCLLQIGYNIEFFKYI